MGTFPLPAPNPPQQAMTINNISTLSQQSLGSYDHGVVPSHSKHTSLLLVSRDSIPLYPSSSREHLRTSTHNIWRTKRNEGRCRKRKKNKKAPASRHDVGHPPLASFHHSGGKVPTCVHHVGKKLTNAYHART